MLTIPHKGGSPMDLIQMTQTTAALAAIAMILLGSGWLKSYLRQNYL